MRTFIAADFPRTILDKIDKITSYFKTQTPREAVKWVRTDNLHLTVKFIGEMEEKKLDSAKAMIVKALEGFTTFEIKVAGLGMFPNSVNPRVIWLGIQDAEPLVEIQNALDTAMARIGIKAEKREFHPHLTIARVRRHIDPKSIHEIGEALTQFRVDVLGTTRIKELNFYQSDLTPQGPIYTLLCSTPLNQV